MVVADVCHGWRRRSPTLILKSLRVVINSFFHWWMCSEDSWGHWHKKWLHGRDADGFAKKSPRKVYLMEQP